MITDYEKAIDSRLDEISELTEEDRATFGAWKRYLLKDKGRAVRSVFAYTNSLLAFARWWRKPLDDLTYEDAVDYKDHARKTSHNPHNMMVGPRVYLKFRTWKDDKAKLNNRFAQPEICEGFRLWETRSNDESIKLRSMPVLTVEEINALMELALKTSFSRMGEWHACQIAVLYATAFRQDEFLSMRVQDLFEEDGVIKARCPRSKTIPRVVPVTWGEDFARRAMQLRRDADPNSPLWVSKTGKPLRTIDHYLRRIVRRAPPDTQKKFRDAGKLAHLFRHSRVAHWARVGMDIYELRDLGGWTDFEMPNRYIHAVGGKKMKRIPQPKTQTCSSCGHKSPVTYAWCPMCGEPLAQKAKEAQARVVTKRAEADSILDRLLQDDEFIEVMKAKLIEHGLVGGKD